MPNPIKLREPEARLLALQIAATFPNHTASTSDIKRLAPEFREFSEADLKQSPTRPNETMWQQILGNAIASHKNSGPSIYKKGLAERTEDGLRVTPKGILYLKSHGRYESEVPWAL
jgi:hypothetical protein